MTRRAAVRVSAGILGLLTALAPALGDLTAAAQSPPSPEQFIGFRVGTDNKLARWDRVLAYLEAADQSDRVRMREFGKSTLGNPLVVLEISSADTMRRLDRYRQLERRLYLQDEPPDARERDEIFREGKVVVLVTCGVHANEVGATQMAMELTHRLATDDSPEIRKILDNVILLLVPSANPDGQIVITDWFNRNVGTPYEAGPVPYLYHPYAGHDINRDMYMLTQKETQHLARLVWQEWFPSVWLDQHQMDSQGPRIFVMPAADPINPNVHPLIYRWNGILGQSQAAALEAAGRDGIIYNSIYTNFWQGALAWSGWWHNQIGLLTEVASARFAAPVHQFQAVPRQPGLFGGWPRAVAPPDDVAALPAPSDITPRTEYPRPWMGGSWTLRDVVDYQLITTLALLETAADRREAILRSIYEVNRQTAEGSPSGVAAIVIPSTGQHDARQAGHLVTRLQMAGVEVHAAVEPFEVAGRRYDPGTFVIPMTQVFARYAKDLLEKQTYPEVWRTRAATPDPPYDVTAWSLGMLLGVNVELLPTPVPPRVRLNRLRSAPRVQGSVSGSGDRFLFSYSGPDTAIALNRLLAAGARVELGVSSRVEVSRASRSAVETIAREVGLSVMAREAGAPPVPAPDPKLLLRPVRVGVYAPWTGGNADEGWTRWVLEQYEFAPNTIRNDDIGQGALRERFDAIIIPHQSPRDIVDGFNGASIRPEYRGGIGEPGLQSLTRFVEEGGTLVTLGAASDLLIDRLALPVRNLKRGLRRDQHFGPGSILRMQVDPSHPIAFGMPLHTHGFYFDGPYFAPSDDANPATVDVVAHFPAENVLASGWLQGETLMAGRGAIVSVEHGAGRVVLFGIRPQHRGQTQATFPLLFNALYLAAAEGSLRREPPPSAAALR
jgi:hypothetical protein